MAVVAVRLLFLLFLSCDVLFAETDLELTPLNSPSFILPNSEIQLKCKVYGLPNDAFTQGNAISFFRDETIYLGNYSLSFQNTQSNRFTIIGVNRTFCLEVTFSIIGITQEDEGRYECALIDSNSNRLSDSEPVDLHLMKVAPPKYPECSIKRKNGKLELSCEAKDVSPRPTMKWYKGTVYQFAEIMQIKYKDGYKYKVNISKNITDFDDSFVCRYSYFDSVNSDNRTCWIGKPKLSVISTGGSKPHTIGDEVKITFAAFANPQMTKPINCSWDYRGGSDSYRATYDGNTNVMVTLSDVQVAMNGTVVSCTGINAIGKTTASFTLLVEDVVENNLTSSVTTDKVYLSVGQSTTFNCDIGFIPLVEGVSYEWSFHGLPIKVHNAFWEGRFNETHIDNQLVLNAASLDYNGKVISCSVHYNGKTLVSKEREITVCSNPAEACQSSKQEPCQCQIPLVEGALLGIGVLVCAVVILKLVCCIVSRFRKPTTKVNIDDVGDGMRTSSSSFTSSASESQSSNCSQSAHLRRNRSPILKRSGSLVSSRDLPSIPRPTPSLPPLHEYEKTTRTDTYSFIKSDTEPLDTSQVYMDMEAGKEMEKAPSVLYLQKSHHVRVSVDNARDTDPPSGETAPSGAAATAANVEGWHLEGETASRGAAAAAALAANVEGWYMEAERPQGASVQYHDLEDLYRETGKNNVYHQK